MHTLATLPFDVLHSIIKSVPPLLLPSRPWDRSSCMVYHCIDVHVARVISKSRRYCKGDFHSPQCRHRSILYRGIKSSGRIDAIVTYLVERNTLGHIRTWFDERDLFMQDVEIDMFEVVSMTLMKCLKRKFNLDWYLRLLIHPYTTTPHQIHLESLLRDQISVQTSADKRKFGVFLLRFVCEHLLPSDIRPNNRWLSTLVSVCHMQYEDLPSTIIPHFRLRDLTQTLPVSKVIALYKQFVADDYGDPFFGSYDDYNFLVEHIAIPDEFPTLDWNDSFAAFADFEEKDKILEDWLHKGYPITSEGAFWVLQCSHFRGDNFERWKWYLATLEQIAGRTIVQARREMVGDHMLVSDLAELYAYGIDLHDLKDFEVEYLLEYVERDTEFKSDQIVIELCRKRISDQNS